MAESTFTEVNDELKEIRWNDNWEKIEEPGKLLNFRSMLRYVETNDLSLRESGFILLFSVSKL